MHVCACAGVRARVRVCVPERVCARGRAHATCARADGHTCVRARVYARSGSLKPPLALVWLSPASFGRPAQIPRAGKAGRSRNPHTEPTLLRATTGGAGGKCPKLACLARIVVACLARIVELARVRLLVRQRSRGPVLRASPYATKSGAAVLHPHANPWAHTGGHICPKRRSLRWADLRDGDRSDLLLQVVDRSAWDR